MSNIFTGVFLGIGVFMAGFSFGCFVGGGMAELEAENKQLKKDRKAKTKQIGV